MQPGRAIRCELTKWGGRPHWSYAALWLGSDRHGDWIGCPAGTRFARPGHQFDGPSDQVVLVPAPASSTASSTASSSPDDEARAWSLATFHGPGGLEWPGLGGDRIAVYVDMTTPARWHGDTLRAVDLDLDVVKGIGGRVVVDDEDEFAEHQVLLGYPPEVVAAARTSCDAVHAALSAGAPPYDGTHLRWLAALAAISASTEP